MASPHVFDRLDGYLDREYDLATSLEIERHLVACPQCRAEAASRQALIARVSAEGTYHRVPELLRQRVKAGIAAEAERDPRVSAILLRRFAVAASFLLVAGLSSGATYWLTRPAATASLEEQVVASHVRSLLVEGRLTDVPSSDEHTVKPWFNHRIDFAPPVDDWTAQGFPLVGGRLDYLDRRTAAALVYRRRQHLINVFVWPDTAGRAVAPVRSSRQGYAVVHWSDGAMTYWAVSDLNAAELLGFCEAIRSRAMKRS